MELQRGKAQRGFPHLSDAITPAASADKRFSFFFAEPPGARTRTHARPGAEMATVSTRFTAPNTRTQRANLQHIAIINAGVAS